MYIDKENFEAWMERIMDRLDMQDKKIDRLLNSQNCLDGEKLLDNQDLCSVTGRKAYCPTCCWTGSITTGQATYTS